MTDLHPAPPPATPDPSAPTQRRAITLGTLASALAMVMLVAAAAFWSDLLLMAFAAILIAIALHAGARGLHRLAGINDKLGVLIVLLGFLGLLGLLVRVAGPSVAEQFRDLVDALPQSWAALREQVSALPMADQVIDSIEDEESGATLGENAAQLAERLPDIFTMVLGGLNTLFGSLTSAFLLIVLSIYLAMESDLYRRGALRLVPMRHRGRAAQILHELGHQLGRWMAGQALDMLIVAILAGIGLYALGVPLVLILAVIAGLTNIVPIIGPFFSGAIATLVALPQGIDMAIYVALLFTAIQLFEGEVLMPLIQKYAVQLPPALTLLAIVGVGALFGLIAVILATPLLIVVMHLVRRVYVEDVLGDRIDGPGD